MPKYNPKRDSTHKLYYKRARTKAIKQEIKDRTPLYYSLAFIAIVVGIIVLVVVLTTPNVGRVIAQRGDKVNIRYIGTYDNGTIFDEGVLNDQIIGSNNLLQYFDQQLIGMEAGVPKSFSIPPEYGYPSGKLAGFTLNFEVTITKLTRNGLVLYGLF